MGFFGRKKKPDDEESSTGVRSSSGPGAMQVPGGTAVFRVAVPDNVSPGEEFQVHAGGRIVRVRCPPDSRPGQSLQITVPVDPSGSNSAPPPRNPDIPPDSPNVRRVDDPNGRVGSAAYMVTIPEDVRGGQQFPVIIQGQQLMVTCPQNARPGMSVRIVPPPPPEGTDLFRGPSGPHGLEQVKDPPPPSQLFEVEVHTLIQIAMLTNRNPGRVFRNLCIDNGSAAALTN